MTQYCRYCTYFCTGNGNYCSEKNIELMDKQAKSPNKCKLFDLNPIDAFEENKKGYTPRQPKKKEYDGQITLLNMERDYIREAEK